MQYVPFYSLFLTLVFFASYGQNKAYLPQNDIGIKNEAINKSFISNTSVRNIYQDKKGNLLLVSTDGILRYDGRSFTNLTSKISANSFWDVLEDHKGNLWFASVGSGIYYYDGKSYQNYTTRDGLASNSVFEIYEDNAGIMWFGTGDGASRYDGKSFINFKTNEVPPRVQPDSIRRSSPVHAPQTYWMINQTNNTVNTIVEDKTGKIWFGTWGDVCIYDGKTYTTLTKKFGKTFKNTRSIIQDKKGNIWIGGDTGLWRYDGRTFTNLAQNSIKYVHQDHKGNIWTSWESDNDQTWSLSRYDAKSLSDKKPVVTQIASSSKGIFGIAEAHDGSIWFGAPDGAYRYDGKTTKVR